MSLSLREEFLASFDWPDGPYREIYMGLMMEGAKWMSENLAKKFEKMAYRERQSIADAIRTLAKELDT